MLDKRMLEAMLPETIFATGVVKDGRLYKEPVRWIAIRGRIADWAIYYHKVEKSIAFVSMEGDKCFTKEVIRELVPCDDEAFKAYRIY